MKNSFFNSFVPKQPNFFCLLKQLADILSEAACRRVWNRVNRKNGRHITDG